MGSEIIELATLTLTFFLMLYLAYLMGRIRENVRMLRMRFSQMQDDLRNVSSDIDHLRKKI
jgi:hypothetical protein|tara:strand:- start:481 stop:663 length:183 start_codon:yes stop_codon:yes gene_type:complete